MVKITFRAPNGDELLNPSTGILRSLFLDHPSDYWTDQSGDAAIYRIDGNAKSELLIMPNEEHGVYLQLTDIDGIWLSFYDSTRMGEITEAAENIYASVGLFLPWELAWAAVEEFILTGKRSQKIKWITPREVPPEGNY